MIWKSSTNGLWSILFLCALYWASIAELLDILAEKGIGRAEQANRQGSALMNGEIEAIVTYSILAAMLFSYTFSRISSFSKLKRQLAGKPTEDPKE